MSGIKNRRVFYDTTGSLVRFTGWASVTTELGRMVEPFEMSAHTANEPVIDREFDDMIARVDSMRRVDIHQFWRMLSSGVDDPPLHGGHQMPRVGP